MLASTPPPSAAIPLPPSGRVSPVTVPLPASPKSSGDWLPNTSSTARQGGAVKTANGSTQTAEPSKCAADSSLPKTTQSHQHVKFPHLSATQDTSRSVPTSSTQGLTQNSAAGAASRAFAHTVPVEIWTPETATSSAGKAATIASRDHRPVELWKPSSIASAGAAATIASKDHRPVQVWTSGQDSLASTAASRAHATSHSLSVSSPVKIDPQQRITSPDTIVSRDSTPVKTTRPLSQTEIINASALQHGVIAQAGAGEPSSRRRQNDILRAATISMSKSQKNEPPGNVLRKRPNYSSNLEEAAKKVAARRLEKLEEDHAKIGVMRRLSLPSFRATSPRPRGASHDFGRKTLDPGADKATTKKNVDDYLLLMAAAKRNAQDTLGGIDKEISANSGLTAQNEWEARATRIAEENSAQRMRNYGKISIGGGAYMNKEDIDDIASRNVKPVLEEISDKAEWERAKIEEQRLEQQQRERLEELEKQRNKELKEEKRRSKALEKEEAMKRKEEEKREKKRQKSVKRRDSIFSLGIDNQPRGSSQFQRPTEERPLSPPTSPNDDSKSSLRSWFNRFRRQSRTETPRPGQDDNGQMTPPASPTPRSPPGPEQSEQIEAREDVARPTSSGNAPQRQGGFASLVHQITRKGSMSRKRERPLSPAPLVTSSFTKTGGYSPTATASKRFSQRYPELVTPPTRQSSSSSQANEARDKFDEDAPLSHPTITTPSPTTPLGKSHVPVVLNAVGGGSETTTVAASHSRTGALLSKASSETTKSGISGKSFESRFRENL